MTYQPLRLRSAFPTDRLAADPDAPGAAGLALGVALPAAAVLMEWIAGFCADVFFDPLPDWPHLLLAAAVPGVNFLLWRAARGIAPPPRWLPFLGGAALAVAAAYAVLFLPLLPIAFIGVLLFGLGLLPFGPLSALVLGWRWIAVLDRDAPGAPRCAGFGFAAGLLLLLAVELPAAVAALAVGWAEEGSAGEARGARWVRETGAEGALLAFARGGEGRAPGLFAFAATAWTNGPFDRRPEADRDVARRLYFRATGVPWNRADDTAPAARRGWFWDEDQGGQRVGGRVPGLSLASSRFDGSVSPANNLAYVQWTAAFTNAADRASEARLQLALPEGAVVSRATLWVNGEPREGSVAGRGEARRAYQGVVSVQRDPLLVTTAGAGRVLVQAFPVPAKGEIKLRLGITAPLSVAPDGARSLALPQFAERNFAVPDEARHAVWVEAGARRWREDIADVALLRRRPRLLLGPAVPSSRAAALPADGARPALAATQALRRVPADRSPLHILVDGSAGSAAAAGALRAALPAIAPGRFVALTIAGENGTRVPAAPWSLAQRERVADVLAGHRFRGGQDNLPALATAAASAGGGNLLWVHGPQPEAAPAATALLEQLLEREAGLPRLVRYQAEPGPMFALPGEPWFDAARVPSPSADPAADLRTLLSELGGAGPRWVVERSEGVAPDAAPGSPHLVRLWAAERLAGAGNATGAARHEAVALAHRLNLVTPVSGAVVLETDREYQANGLPAPAAEDVPTLPEPGTWALLIVMAGAAGWALRRARALAPLRAAA